MNQRINLSLEEVFSQYVSLIGTGDQMRGHRGTPPDHCEETPAGPESLLETGVVNWQGAGQGNCVIAWLCYQRKSVTRLDANIAATGAAK